MFRQIQSEQLSGNHFDVVQQLSVSLLDVATNNSFNRNELNDSSNSSSRRKQRDELLFYN